MQDTRKPEMVGLFVASGFTRAYAEHMAGNYLQGIDACKATGDPVQPIAVFLKTECEKFPEEWEHMWRGEVGTMVTGPAMKLVASWGDK